MGVTYRLAGKRLTREQMAAIDPETDDRLILHFLGDVFNLDGGAHETRYAEFFKRAGLYDLVTNPDIEEFRWDKYPDGWRPPLVMAQAARTLAATIQSKEIEALALLKIAHDAHGTSAGLNSYGEMMHFCLLKLAEHCELAAAKGEELVCLEQDA